MRELFLRGGPLRAWAFAVLLSSTWGLAFAADTPAPQFQYRFPLGAMPKADIPAVPSPTQGQGSTLILTQSTAAFGDVERGASGYSVGYSITNMGAPATFAVQEPEAFHVDFIASGCASTTYLPTGASCSFVVRFVPSELRSYDRLIAWTNVSSQAPGGTAASLRVTGRGVSQAVALSTSSWGDVKVGQSVPGSAILSNQGSLPLTMTPPSAGATSGAGFSFSGTTCGATLPAGETCRIDVMFSPDVAQDFEASVTLQTSLGPRVARLAGRGVQGTSNPNPSVVDFGVVYGNAMPVQQVRLFNLGNAPVTYSRIGILPGAPAFEQTNDCGSPVPGGGGSCLVTITYVAGYGSANATLVAEHDGAGGLTTVALTGLHGNGLGPVFAVSNTDFGFAMHDPSPWAPRQINFLTVRNISPAALTLGTVSASSVTAPFYVVTGKQYAFDTCSGQTLEVNATCQLAIEWVVRSNETVIGNLSLTTTNGASQLVGLFGNFASATPVPTGPNGAND